MFEKELLKNKQEEEAIKNSLATSKIIFAKQIKNGFGEQIKYELNNPEKPNFFKIFFVGIKNFFKKLINLC